MKLELEKNIIVDIEKEKKKIFSSLYLFSPQTFYQIQFLAASFLQLSGFISSSLFFCPFFISFLLLHLESKMEILKAVVITVMCFFNLVPFIHSFTFNATVSLDGSMNDFKTIAAAIAAAPDNSNTRFYIRVTPGTYHERLQIPPTKTFIALIGDNALTTIIVDDRSNARGFKTSDSATLSKCAIQFLLYILWPSISYYGFSLIYILFN